MGIPMFVEDDFHQIDYKNFKFGGEAIVLIGSYKDHGYSNLEIFKLNCYFSKVAIKKWHNNLSDTKMEKILKREIQILRQVGKRKL